MPGSRHPSAGMTAPNHGFVQNFFWIPEYAAAFVEAGEFLKQGAQR